MTHFIVKCKGCGAVVEQCRCASTDKPVRYVAMCRHCMNPKNLPEGAVFIAAEATVLGYFTCANHSVYWSKGGGDRCPFCEVKRLQDQIAELAKFLLERQLAPKGDESACEAAARVLHEQTVELVGLRASLEERLRRDLHKLGLIDAAGLADSEECLRQIDALEEAELEKRAAWIVEQLRTEVEALGKRLESR